ncbi:putative ABC transporter permease [Eubacteriales bacterium OttesenSCG-928-M02]|nr:putative ABC transporter permease [Eubacteriales bacterium OttesenSCG-928-M02]
MERDVNHPDMMDTVDKTVGKKIFAGKWGFSRIFMFFFIGCIIGVVYEELLYFFQSGIWETRRGVIYGPFNPVYGLGFMAFVLLLGKKNDTRPWYLTYLFSCLIGGIAEFSLSWVEEIAFGASSWDYSDKFLNIAGRTTIPYMMFWGLGGLLFMKLVYPFFSTLISKIPYKFGKIMLPVLVVFMCLNMFVTYTALFRQNNRLGGKAPLTPLGTLYDAIYPDEYLHKVFPTMVHHE